MKKISKKYTAKSYKEELQKSLANYLDLMEKTWGFRPNIQVSVEPALVVHTDFNIKGFAHKGRKFWLTSQKSMNGYRKSHNVAKSITKEVVSHRNTCRECGIGVDSIFARRHHMRHSNKALVAPDAVERELYPKISKEIEDYTNNRKKYS